MYVLLTNFDWFKKLSTNRVINGRNSDKKINYQGTDDAEGNNDEDGLHVCFGVGNETNSGLMITEN